MWTCSAVKCAQGQDRKELKSRVTVHGSMVDMERVECEHKLFKNFFVSRGYRKSFLLWKHTEVKSCSEIYSTSLVIPEWIWQPLAKRRINMLSDLGFREILIQCLHAYTVLLASCKSGMFWKAGKVQLHLIAYSNIPLLLAFSTSRLPPVPYHPQAWL